MPISFHCENCKKKITAPDSAGGKWGKCPFCNHRCYIPMPKRDDEEELKLAPINEDEEKKYEQMMQETRNLTGTLLHQTASASGTDEEVTAPDKELTVLIISYLRFMADGHIEDAQKTADKIVSCGNKAKIILENILRTDQSEPELADMPKKVLVGFVKGILAKIK